MASHYFGTRAAQPAVDSYFPEYVDDVFSRGTRIKLLSDDPVINRGRYSETCLYQHHDTMVVTKAETLHAKHGPGVSERLAKLVTVPRCDTLLIPHAYTVARATSELRMVVPCVASASTVCLDLIQFLFPTGIRGLPISLTRDELSLFVLDMLDALSTLHAHDITLSAVEPNNILVEFEAATHGTPRRVLRYVLADFRRQRVYPNDRAEAKGYPYGAFFLPDVTSSSPVRAGLQHDAYQLGMCLLWLMLPTNADLRARPFSAEDQRHLNDSSFSDAEYLANIDELGMAVDAKVSDAVNVRIMKQLLKCASSDWISTVRDMLARGK